MAEYLLAVIRSVIEAVFFTLKPRLDYVDRWIAGTSYRFGLQEIYLTVSGNIWIPLVLAVIGLWVYTRFRR